MKVRAMVVLVLTLLFCLVLPANAINKMIVLKIGDPYMSLDGVRQAIDPGRQTKPVVINGTTLVPIRTIVENMGGSLTWDPKLKKVTVLYFGKTIRLTIGYNKADVKEWNVAKWQSKILTIKPMVVNGRTMLPLRFVTEELGATVTWNGPAKTILIRYADRRMQYWSGTWQTNYGPMKLSQFGINVTGSNDAWGKIQGVASGKDMAGTWFINPYNKGDLIITVSEDKKSFKAKWRYTCLDTSQSGYGEPIDDPNVWYENDLIGWK